MPFYANTKLLLVSTFLISIGFVSALAFQNNNSIGIPVQSAPQQISQDKNNRLSVEDKIIDLRTSKTNLSSKILTATSSANKISLASNSSLVNSSLSKDVRSVITPDKTIISDQKIAPLINELKTDKPVIFLGIDDGIERNPEALKFFEQRKWSVTLFLNKIYYDKDPSFFKSILDTGANLGNHTINHPNLSKLTYEQQKKEICAAQEAYKKDFGITPKFFRPPYGNYNSNTQKAVKDCGMIAMINWKARVDQSKVWYQAGDKLKKGEIVLMHFRPKMIEDLKAFEDEIKKQGLEVANLNDWLG